MKIKKILVPVDFSKLSTKALEIAEKMAGLFDSRITPVHVHIPITEMDEPYALGMSSSVYQDLDKIEKNLTDRLEEISREHVDESLLNDPIIAFGNPAQSITDLSEEYDLLVMTSHGRTGFSRFLLGSVAEKVLRLSSCPVLVVEEESEIGDLERILVTTDFSENSAIAFPLTVEISRRAGSKIHLLHILSYEQFKKGETDMSIEDLRKERLKLVANKYFQDVKNNISWSVAPSEESPHEAILNHVKENSYQLIIMATVGRTGIKHLMMGSTTTNVVRHVKTAVLSINPRKVKASETDDEIDD